MESGLVSAHLRIRRTAVFRLKRRWVKLEPTSAISLGSSKRVITQIWQDTFAAPGRAGNSLLLTSAPPKRSQHLSKFQNAVNVCPSPTQASTKDQLPASWTTKMRLEKAFSTTRACRRSQGVERFVWRVLLSSLHGCAESWVTLLPDSNIAEFCLWV